ncbi:MAG: SPOR domain-containing protein [Geobacteraceae bacterium]
MVKKGLSVSEGKNGLAGSRGSSVKGILFLLFALAVCFGYFYFFTDVLRTQEETPGQPDVYTSEVRKPLPERLVQSPVSSAEEAVSSPPVASSLPAAPPSGKVPTDLMVSPGEASSGQKAAKPVPVAEKPASAPAPVAKTDKAAAGKSKKPIKLSATKKTVSAKPVLDSSAGRKNAATQKHPETKKSPSTGIAKAGSRPTPATGGVTKKPVIGQKSAAGKVAKIPLKGASPKKNETIQQAGAIKPGERYTLVVGSYVLKSSMSAAKVKLEKAGLQTSVVPGKMRSEPMNRLLVAEVSSAQAAQEELAKVKKASKDAFFLKENNKYAIYAGSYFSQDRAAQEQERLRKQGFVLILKKSQAPVSTYALSTGSYASREAALKGAENLKKLGFSPYPAAVKN